MIKAYKAKQLKKFATSRRKKESVMVEGIPLQFVLIDGEWFFNVVQYLKLFRRTNKKGKPSNSLISSYYSWRRRYDDKGSYGRVVAIRRNYYADLEYFMTLTRGLNLVEDNGSMFTTTTDLQYEDGVIAIYRGHAKPPQPVTDSNAGYSWDDFYEVTHASLVGAPGKKSIGANVPISREPERGGIVKPKVADDMPEVIKINHPVTKEDALKVTAARAAVIAGSKEKEVTEVAPNTPPAADSISTLATTVSGLVSQLVSGKKIKLTVTLELE